MMITFVEAYTNYKSKPSFSQKDVTSHSSSLPQTINIPEGELMNHSKALDLSSVIQEAEFEGIINRNSTKYIELYNIPEVHSILRGSIRYKVQ